GVSPRVIVDPACSTGAFLAEMREAFPAATAIGLDGDASMVDVARTRLGTATLANAIDLTDYVAEVDVLVARFLNSRVVTTRTAFQLLQRIAATLAIDGTLVLVGHTPVLIPVPFLTALGFSVERATARDGDCVFQLIVARRGSILRHIEH